MEEVFKGLSLNEHLGHSNPELIGDGLELSLFVPRVQPVFFFLMSEVLELNSCLAEISFLQVLFKLFNGTGLFHKGAGEVEF